MSLSLCVLLKVAIASYHTNGYGVGLAFAISVCGFVPVVHRLSKSIDVCGIYKQQLSKPKLAHF